MKSRDEQKKNYFAYELKCFWSPYNEKFLIWKEFLMRKKDEKFHRLYSLLTAINFPFSLSSALDYSLFIISRAIHIAYIMPSTIESHSHVFVFLERIFFCSSIMDILHNYPVTRDEEDVWVYCLCTCVWVLLSALQRIMTKSGIFLMSANIKNNNIEDKNVSCFNNYLNE